MGGRTSFRLWVALLLTLAISVVMIQAQTTSGTTAQNSEATTKDSTGATTKEATTKDSTGATTKDSTGATTNKATTKDSTGATTKKASTKDSTGATTKKASTKNSTEAATQKASTKNSVEEKYEREFATMTGKLVQDQEVADDFSPESIAAKNNTGAMTNTRSQWMEVAPYTGESYENSYGVFQSSAVLRWAFKVYFAKVRSSSATSRTEWFMGFVSSYGMKCFTIRLHSEKGMNFKQCLELASASTQYNETQSKQLFTPASFYYGVSDGECTLYAEWRKPKFKTCFKARGLGEVAFYFKTSQPSWWDPCGGMKITLDCTIDKSGKGVEIFVFLKENYCICDINSVTIEFMNNGVEREFTAVDNYYIYRPNAEETAGSWYRNHTIVRVNSPDYDKSVAATHFECDPDVG